MSCRDIAMYVLLLEVSLEVSLGQDCQSEVPGQGRCPEDPRPRTFSDLADCSSYWLCVGGCAVNMQVKSRWTLIEIIAKIFIIVVSRRLSL